MAEKNRDIVLEGIKSALPKQIVRDAWVADSSIRAANVALYRRYYDGDFDAQMTVEMRKALRLPEGREFDDNFCEMVVAAMSDRLIVTSIAGSTDEATAWMQQLANNNRFDGLQGDVHDGTLVDADTYLMVDWDNEEQRVRWTHEPAYDGIEGMIGIPKRRGSAELALAVKLWHETRTQYADTLRMNVYYPDHIERFINRGDGNGLQRFSEDGEPWRLDWTDRQGTPLGVPAIHFANKRRGKGGFGLSELKNVVGQQDMLNRLNHSIVMTAETTGFRIGYSIGWEPDVDIVPGAFIVVAPEDEDGNPKTPSAQEIEHLKAIKIGQLDVADLTPLLQARDKAEEKLGKTTRTPDVGAVADDASGEARKQAEIGLLGKIKKFQIRAGNSWEDAAALSVRVNDAFSTQKAPPSRSWRCEWKSAEIRNDNDVFAQAEVIEKLATLKAALQHMAQVTGWDSEYIEALLADREQQESQRMERMLALSPGFAGRPQGQPPRQPQQLNAGPAHG